MAPGPAHVPIDDQDTARRPWRTPRRSATSCWSAPDTYAATRPASGPGCRSARRSWTTSQAWSARRWTRSAPRRSCSRPAAQGALRGVRPLGGVRRPALPPQGPQGRRLPPRPHPRGDLHPDRQGPVHVLQGPAGDALPDPDEVPRRGPPRSGVLRGREFQMKDSYSFDTTDEGLAHSYALHRAAYIKIFERLGLDHRIVSAVSGAMGGSASEEFLAPAAAGEDTFADCPNCDYAANTEAVTFALAPVDGSAHGAVEELDTPDTPTIETLAEHLGVPASATLKNLLVKVDGEIVAVGVPWPPRGRPRQARRAPGPRRRRAGHRRGLRRPRRPRPRLRRLGPGEGPLPRRPPRRPRHLLDHRRQQGGQAREERGRGP